jgi:hypothetical protein
MPERPIYWGSRKMFHVSAGIGDDSDVIYGRSLNGPQKLTVMKQPQLLCLSAAGCGSTVFSVARLDSN